MPLILRIVLALALGAVSYYLFSKQFNIALSAGASALLFISPLIAALLSPLFVAAPKKKTSPSNPKAVKVKPAARARPSGNNAAATETGEVKWFNVSKGYGFITRDNGDDIFVHYRSIIGEGRRNLREGQMVEFIAGNGDKGPQAESVQILD